MRAIIDQVPALDDALFAELVAAVAREKRRRQGPKTPVRRYEAMRPRPKKGSSTYALLLMEQLGFSDEAIERARCWRPGATGDAKLTNLVALADREQELEAAGKITPELRRQFAA
ncbi:MAG TPA: hypothetical protein VG265_14125 [Gaiellaceae bacterium]|jgi:hypothetical protein|nr:hypothetical protein [Gaiellaceae bacterium]